MMTIHSNRHPPLTRVAVPLWMILPLDGVKLLSWSAPMSVFRQYKMMKQKNSGDIFMFLISGCTTTKLEQVQNSPSNVTEFGRFPILITSHGRLQNVHIIDGDESPAVTDRKTSTIKSLKLWSQRLLQENQKRKPVATYSSSTHRYKVDHWDGLAAVLMEILKC